MTGQSVTRSLVRYLASSLGEEWDFSLAGDESFGRPWCRIVPATPLVSSPHGARHRESRRTFSIVAFPSIGLNAESSAWEASRIEGVLLDALAQGTDAAGFSSRSARRHPLRVPLFDYSGIALHEAATDAHRAGWARVVEPPAFEAFADPADPEALVVAGTVRLAWSEFVGLPPSGVLARTVGARRAG